MSALDVLLSGSQKDSLTYIDDVFNATLYAGTGLNQDIVTGIDLSGSNEGMVWLKSRNSADQPLCFDTVRGATKTLYTDSAGSETTELTSLTAFLSNGFSVGDHALANRSADLYIAYTFKAAKKFFDVVTYTGTGVAGLTVTHGLGQVPAFILVKNIISGSWMAYHSSLGATKVIEWHMAIAAATDGTAWNNTEPTENTFTIGTSGDTNKSGDPYVAYLFAHHTSGLSDGIISVGSFTTNASRLATISLGWEPQMIMLRKVGGSDAMLFDFLRGMPTNTAATPALAFNNNTAESLSTLYGVLPTPDGFKVDGSGFSISSQYVYIAIRRPNKPPVSGADVFNPVIYTGTNVDNAHINTGILTDMVMMRQRNGSGTGHAGMLLGDRVNGQRLIKTGKTTNSELTLADGLDQQKIGATELGTAFSSMNGVWVGNNGGTVSDDVANVNLNTTASNHIALAFKRAIGVFDIVSYVGNGGAPQTVKHGLKAIPELMIVQRRDSVTSPMVYYGDVGKSMRINATEVPTASATIWGNTAPNADNFFTGYSTATGRYTAYLFASKAGISKVGTYTGSGAAQTVNCGFTTGARFVLIKRIDAVSDWVVFDTARGITSGNDPILALNGNAAESTAAGLNPDTSGFSVEAASSHNVSGGTYLYLAIA